MSDTDPEKENEEVKRLAGKPPLKTLLTLMIGPLASQITSALYGIINTIWISKYIGEQGMAAVATDIALENITRAVGLFLSVAGSSQISALFGKKLFKDAEQVICDILRVAIICGCIVPALILSINKPLSRWYGADETTVENAFKYILPQASGNVLTCIFLSSVGFLQAEGRTLLVGLIDFVSLGIGMCCLNPLFLAVIKTGIAGPSYSTIIADGVPGITLVILYFSGRFGVKPKLSGFIKPFSPHTKQALLVGSSQLIAQISFSIPGIFLRKLIGSSVANPQEYDLAMAGFNVLCRYNNIVSCVVLALTTGYMAAASYAYAAKNYRRYLRLSIHLNWTAFSWSFTTSLLAICLSRQISSIFGSGDDYLSWASQMLRISNTGSIILFARFSIQSMLQAQQRGIRAIIISFSSNFFVYIVGSYLLYFTDKHNAIRLMWIFAITYAFGMVCGCILLSCPLYEIIKSVREEGNDLQNDSFEDEKSNKMITEQIGNESHEEDACAEL